MTDEILYTVFQGDCIHIDVQPLDDDGVGFDFAGSFVEIGIDWGDDRWTDDSDGGVTFAAADGAAPGVLGVISCTVPGSVTAIMPTWRRPVLQVRLTDSQGCKQTLLAGRVHVKPDAFA